MSRLRTAGKLIGLAGLSVASAWLGASYYAYRVDVLEHAAVRGRAGVLDEDSFKRAFISALKQQHDGHGGLP